LFDGAMSYFLPNAALINFHKKYKNQLFIFLMNEILVQTDLPLSNLKANSMPTPGVG